MYIIAEKNLEVGGGEYGGDYSSSIGENAKKYSSLKSHSQKTNGAF